MKEKRTKEVAVSIHLFFIQKKYSAVFYYGDKESYNNILSSLQV